MALRADRAAHNEAAFRETNESINRIATRFDSVENDFVCECADPGCAEFVTMRLDEYEAVRSRGDRFFVVAGHDDPTIERVVERHERFVVVEKIGPGAEIAEQLDPRNGDP
jgi:hypothetical protein